MCAVARNVLGHRNVRRLICRQSLETVEHPFDNFACLVEVGAIAELNFAVLAGRDAGACVQFDQPIPQVVLLHSLDRQCRVDSGRRLAGPGQGHGR